MSMIQRRTVITLASLYRWLKTAQRDDWFVYHAGNLAHDRLLNPDLSDLADLILLLTDFGYLTTTQHRRYLFIMDVFVYVATRTGNGYCPPALITGKLTSHEFRALRAVRDRDADISVIRAVRDALSASQTSSDLLATRMFDSLKDRKLVQEAKGGSWELSRRGLEIMT